MREITIIGVDPGTTVGWAALNKKGEVISIGSRKGMAPDELTELLREIGKVVIIGTDKAKVPSLVKTISSRFRAKIAFPKKDISKLDKKELTKKRYFLNDHERDALAAAKFAQKKYKILLRKISSYAAKYDKKKIEDQIIEKAVKTECSIVHAVEQIEHKEIKKETKKAEIKEKKASVETILRKENIALRKTIARLQERLRTAAAKASRLEAQKEEMIRSRPREHIISQKEQIIRTLRKDLGKAVESLNDIAEERKNILKELIRLDKKIIIKCLPNLGMSALERLKPKLKENDVLFVKDPNSFSEKAVEELKRLEIDLIIHEKPLTNKVKKMLPFTFVPKKEVKIKIFGDIGFLEKETLEKNKKLIVRKIMEDYWAERTL